MAELATVARPYARAAFDSARQHAQIASWDALLARAAAVVEDARVEPLIGNPRVRADELVSFILQLAGDASAPVELATEQRNFLQLLADNRRLPLLAQIAVEFAELRAQAERVADVEVRSAHALTSAQAETLRTVLEQRLKLSVRLQQAIDASLLGGAIVRYGDFVVDGSVRGRIERLRATLGGE